MTEARFAEVETDTRVAHCAQAENDDPRADCMVAVASRASAAMRAGGRDESGAACDPAGWLRADEIAADWRVREAAMAACTGDEWCGCDVCFPPFAG